MNLLWKRVKRYKRSKYLNYKVRVQSNSLPLKKKKKTPFLCVFLPLRCFVFGIEFGIVTSFLFCVFCSLWSPFFLVLFWSLTSSSSSISSSLSVVVAGHFPDSCFTVECPFRNKKTKQNKTTKTRVKEWVRWLSSMKNDETCPSSCWEHQMPSESKWKAIHFHPNLNKVK